MVCYFTRHIYRNFILALLLIILAGSATPAIAQEPPPTAEPNVDPRFGIVDTFVNSQEATAAGAGWTRVFFRWDVVQSGGASDWKPTNVPDPLLNTEFEAGREVVAVLIGTPTWATNRGLSTAVPPTEMWGDFVFKLATQYKSRIKHWVIWNQPDINDPTSPNYTWDGTEQDYFNLLKEAYLKIKAVDPEMQVHLAGLTYTWDRDHGNRQYLDRLLDIIIADPEAAANNYYFDAVSYHIYYDPRQILQIMTDVRHILEARGLGNKAIWINETNAPPSEDYLEPLQAPAQFNITLEEQSAFITQAYALGLAGGAARIAFNKMRNETNHPESAAPYGLIRGDNSRRPAFDAFRTVTTYFAGAQQVTWQQLGSVYVVTLDRGGQTTTVLWNLSTAPTSFTLNAIAPQALLVDSLGNQQPMIASNGVYAIDLPGALCSNGNNCFIGGAPRLVIEAGTPAQRTPLSAPVLDATLPSPTLPASTSTPTPTAATTVAAPPTLTSTPLLTSATAIVAQDSQQVAQSAVNTPTPEASAQQEPVAPVALPNPGVGQAGDDISPVATVTFVPARNV